MSTVGDLHRAVATRLADQGQQYTTNRRSIVASLAAAGGPITLPDLLVAADGDLAQSSAYRNLAVLCEAGVVRRLVHVGDHALFELDEDLTEHHHHLVCERCGTVVDVILPPTVESEMDHAFAQAAAAAGFTADHHAVDIYGTCAACA
jgi:Fur family ferric uptake transcriptional regulator